METDDSGELWLKNRLRVGTDGTSTVEIGYLDAVRAETDVHEVIHAGDTNSNQNFIVYEDGKMVAQGAEFHGAIYATGGEIGQLTIGEVVGAVGNMNSVAEATRKLDISSKLGYNFKVEGENVTPNTILLEAKPIGFECDVIEWFGSVDFIKWDPFNPEEGKTENLNLSYNEFLSKNPINSTYYIKAKTKAKDTNKDYESWCTIMALTTGEKGEKGEDAVVLIIMSSNGTTFRNGQIKTVLTARLFKGTTEIDDYPNVFGEYQYTYTWKDATTNEVIVSSNTAKSIEVTPRDVNFSKTYICDVG